MSSSSIRDMAGTMSGDEGWSIAPSRRAKDMVAVGVAIGVHVVIGVGLLIVNPPNLVHREAIVEMEVKEQPLPPPELHPERPLPPPPVPEPTKPRIVPRRLAVLAPRPPTPSAPPPPNQAPPKPTDAPPVFGVTLSSTVAGAAMAVPVGNTLMTKDRTPAKPGVIPQPSGTEGARPFTPVADVYIADPPKVLHEVNSADIYPPEAYKMGIEGKVVLKVSLDAKGNVVQVKVISRAGHGLDEAARDALRQFKFSPARTSDGQAVDYSLTYTYVFDMSH
jgi:periplasmic protein TonB